MDPLIVNVILLSPLFLGLILSQFLRLNLKMLQGMYLILVAGNVLLSYFLTNQWLPAVIIGVAGFLVLLVATGVLGERVRPSDYSFMEIGAGLFPWALWGFSASMIYGVVLVLFAVLIALRPKFKNPLRRTPTR